MNEKKKGKSQRFDTGTRSNLIYLPFVGILVILYIIYLIIATPSNTELIPILTGTGIQDFLILLVLINYID